LFFFAWREREKNTLDVPKGVSFKLQSSGRFENEIHIQKTYNLSEQQMYWRREEIKRYSYNLKTFAQENPVNLDECFQASGVNVFTVDDINFVETDTREPYWKGILREKDGKVIFEETAGGWLLLWAKPDELYDNRYNIVLDTGGKWETSEKIGSDWNFCTVRDRLTKQLAAMFRIRAAAHVVADRLLLVGRYFDNGQIVVEINKWNNEVDAQGEPIVNYLRDNYSNIYHHKILDKDSEQWTRKLGFFTTKPLKRDIVDKWDYYLTNYKDLGEHLNSRLIAKELKTYVVKEKEGVYGAVDGERDDGVMSYGINLLTSDDLPTPKKKQKTVMTSGKEKNWAESLI